MPRRSVLFGAWWVCALGMLAALPSARVRAQAGASADALAPAMDADGFVTIAGTRTPGHLRWNAALSVDYANTLLAVASNGGAGDVSVLEHRLTTRFAGQVGLGGRLVLGAALPVIPWQSGEALGVSAPELKSTVLGDPRVELRYRLFGDAAHDDDAYRDGPGVALQLNTDLPIGSEHGLASDGVLRAQAAVIADLQVLGFGLAARAGYGHRFGDANLLGHTLHGDFLFGAALKMPLPWEPAFSGVFEVAGHTDFESSAVSSLEGTFGARWTHKSLAVQLSGGAGLWGGLGAPDGRVMLTFWYAPTSSDVDNDGVDDDVDECPMLAEDRDGFRDRDGCPDPDNDNDLIPDADDRCPSVEALEGQDEDEDGCTDGK